MTTLSFFVPGIPAPKGSKVANRYGGMREANKRTMPWMNLIASHADEVRTNAGHAGCVFESGSVLVSMTFFFPRPKSHFKKSGELRADAPIWHTNAPDIDKLQRCVLDGLQLGMIFRNDSQVCHVSSCLKQYTTQVSRPVVMITVSAI